MLCPNTRNVQKWLSSMVELSLAMRSLNLFKGFELDCFVVVCCVAAVSLLFVMCCVFVAIC